MKKLRFCTELFVSLVVLHASIFVSVTPTRAETLAEIRRYAIQGNPEAQFSLGLAHEEGKDGLKPDLNLARKWYEKAAAGGHDLARNRLAVMYYNGLGGLEKDVPRAAKLLEVSAAKDDDVAQFMLGSMYYSGADGIKKDEVKALKLLRRSAEQGNKMAQDTVGVMTYNGEGGLTKDPAKAREWYQKSADQNYPLALMHLSFLHFEGKGGLAQNRFKAEELMQKAAELGDVKAKGILAAWQKTDNETTPIAPPLQPDADGNFDGKPVLYKHGGEIVAPPLPENEVPKLEGQEQPTPSKTTQVPE